MNTRSDGEKRTDREKMVDGIRPGRFTEPGDGGFGFDGAEPDPNEAARLEETALAREKIRTDGEQERDELGRFGSGGGGASGGAETASIAKSIEPKEFHAAFEAQMKDSPFTAFVSHYSPEELAGMKTMTNKGGTAGIAVKDHGDGRIEGTALFAKAGAEKGAGIALLKDAITNHGVNYVECYGGQLDKMYAKLGFEEESRSAFNKEYAAPNWNYERFGKPDYVTMRLKK